MGAGRSGRPLWAYYDHSRNRRRTWCSMDICGNRAEARASHHRKSAARP
ncbi:CGNR zinc finger domain-containing protein [Nonomuraea sp. NPDC049400]